MLPYGMFTFTRKKQLAEFVGSHEPSVRLSHPSTVYTRSFFVPPSFKSGSQSMTASPSFIEITARNTSVASRSCAAATHAILRPSPFVSAEQRIHRDNVSSLTS